jgi:hypothetical protein
MTGKGIAMQKVLPLSKLGKSKSKVSEMELPGLPDRDVNAKSTRNASKTAEASTDLE